MKFILINKSADIFIPILCALRTTMVEIFRRLRNFSDTLNFSDWDIPPAKHVLSLIEGAPIFRCPATGRPRTQGSDKYSSFAAFACPRPGRPASMWEILRDLVTTLPRYIVRDALTFLLLATLTQLFTGCSARSTRPDWYFGVGGKYNEAEMEMIRGRSGNMDKAIVNLEGIVKENPTYRDSLTLLGRAYYRKGRYYDAYLVLQRAIAVKKDDDVAWLTFGLAQIKIGDAERGLESIKGGLTSLNKHMATEEYRGYAAWDQNGSVRVSLRRAVIVALKGLAERDNLVSSTEQLLARIDDEEWAQRRGQVVDKAMEGT